MKTKRPKLDLFNSLSRQRSFQVLVFIGVLYMLLVSLELPFVFKTRLSSGSQDAFNDVVSKPFILQSEEELQEKEAPIRPFNLPRKVLNQSLYGYDYRSLSRLNFDGIVVNTSSKDGFLGLQKSAIEAFDVGKKFWVELNSGKLEVLGNNTAVNRTESCPHSISLSGAEFVEKGKIMVIPCGMTLGSHITLVGKPKQAHPEQDPKISLLKEGQYVMVSQFMMELQGLKTVDGEDPPRILHFNPRLKGDWSGKPVIEQNTCYRMQWGSGLRCEGWKSRADEETGEFIYKALLLFFL